jgi:hypothetical protein
LKINGKWTPYDTGTFDASMSVEVNANLGKGSDMVRLLALNQIKQDQQLIVTQMGMGNPICGIPELLNTQTDMLALANIKNVGRYFKTPNPMQMQAMASAPKPPDPMLLAAQAQMEKVRADTAKSVGQQNIDRERMTNETTLKHLQLQAKTQLDAQKLELEGHKVGVDNHVQMAQLASQLMRDQQDSDQADQDGQMKMADQQNQQDQVAQQREQAQNEAQLKAAQMASQHMQAMHKIGSSHVQAMTQLAANHHAQMTGHGMKGAQIVAGALAQGADQDHEAEQNDLDRQHQAATTAATLGNAQKIARMRPSVGRGA